MLTAIVDENRGANLEDRGRFLLARYKSATRDLRELNSESLFTLLAFAQCGVFAVTVDQNIVFWNAVAERMLGYSAQEVIGRRCDLIESDDGQMGLTEQCEGVCAGLRAVRAGVVPSTVRVRMLCREGGRKTVTVNPMVVSGVIDGAALLVHLFEEPGGGEAAVEEEGLIGGLRAGQGGRLGSQEAANRVGLTDRELEVLRMLAAGADNDVIGEKLEISLYTVRNHVRNLRQKLGAGTKLEAVVAAVRLGIVYFK